MRKLMGFRTHSYHGTEWSKKCLECGIPIPYWKDKCDKCKNSGAITSDC